MKGYGEFLGEQRLTDEEIDLISQWIDQDCPQGDTHNLPTPTLFKEGWVLGKPDLVLDMNGEFVIPADGPDIYRSLVFPLNLAEDKWVRGIALRSQARNALHHADILLADAQQVRRQDGADGKTGMVGCSFKPLAA